MTVRVLAGASHGVQGAVSRSTTEPLYLDVSLPAGAVFEQPLPTSHNAFVAVMRGQGAGAGLAIALVGQFRLNRYVPGAKLSLHQDKDELDFAAPIVSVSLGLPAIFMFGGLKRSD